MKLKKWILVILLIISSNALAKEEIIWQTRIGVYIQSSDRQAHLISALDKDKLPECPDNRVYISMQDEDLKAAALALSLSGRSINFSYITDGSEKTIPPHLQLKCQLKSIWTH